MRMLLSILGFVFADQTFDQHYFLGRDFSSHAEHFLDPPYCVRRSPDTGLEGCLPLLVGHRGAVAWRPPPAFWRLRQYTQRLRSADPFEMVYDAASRWHDEIFEAFVPVPDLVGVASAAVTMALRAYGFSNAANYAGGLQDLLP